jgi:hypothetical protein
MGKMYQKKVTVGNFLKKGEDIKEGDIIEIANEGKELVGEYGTQDIFLVKLADGREGNVGINQTSINGFIDCFGEDATKWVGKKVKTIKVKMNVSGKFRDVYFFAHPDAELTESGFVLPGVEPVVRNKKTGKVNEEIPVIEEDGELDVKDIPF